MSGEGRCLKGSPDCKFGGIHELMLVEKVMRMIGNYGEDERINPCPRCLRDTLLAVAALLHLETAKLHAPHGRKGKRFDDEFAKAARMRLKAVADAVPNNVVKFKQW
jgi:hypothetical protein